MKEIAKYDGIEKRYYTKKKKLNMKAWVGILIIPAIILLVLGAVCLRESLSTSEGEEAVDYNEIGSVDYKVYLKNNNYYPEKFLPKGMKYIANLINTINVDFKYEMHSTADLDYKYKYSIVANLIVTDKNDNTKVLYQKPFDLVKEKTLTISDNNFIINEDLDLDYDEYNNYVNAFKKDYALTVDSNLVITMDIETIGEHTTLDKKLDTKNQLKISIPLSEQTIDITMAANDLNNQGKVSGATSLTIISPILFVAGAVLAIIAVIILIIAIYVYLVTRKKKDLYHSTVSKILKEYDRIIVTSKQPNVDERLFDEVIRVMNPEELVDVHDMTGKPIIYYEVIPDEKSYFIIINDRLLYKLTITRAWLERNKGGDK